MTIHKNEKQKAFEQQAIVHTDMLFRFGMSLTRNVSDADDLVQETFLKAYRFWDSFEQGTNLRAWLCRIMKNTFINTHRKNQREPEMVEYFEVTARTSAHHDSLPENNLQDTVFNNVLDDVVLRAMSVLRGDFRTILILSDIEKMTYEEIAHFVGCPLGTVRSRLHRSRKILHSKLYDYAKDRGYVGPTGNAMESLPLVLEG